MLNKTTLENLNLILYTIHPATLPHLTRKNQLSHTVLLARPLRAIVSTKTHIPLPDFGWPDASPSRDKDGLVFGNDEFGVKEDVQHKDNGIFVGVTSSPMTSEIYEIWSVQSPERIEGFDDIDSTDEGVEEKPAICRSSSDIMSWRPQSKRLSLSLMLPMRGGFEHQRDLNDQRTH